MLMNHNDITNFNTNDFGLSELLLQDDYFHHEFEEFCTLENPLLHHYSHLYEFVKTRIYFIVIHQQQIEGLSNKFDLKTHPNMTADLKGIKTKINCNKSCQGKFKGCSKRWP